MMPIKNYKVSHNIKIEKDVKASNHREALEKSARELPKNAQRIRSSVIGPQLVEKEVISGVIDYTGDDIEVSERRAVVSFGPNRDDYKITFRNENGIAGELSIKGSPEALASIMPQIAELWRDGTLTI